MIDTEGRLSLDQHSADRGRSNRRKGAASHIFFMVWLYSLAYPSGEERVFYLFN
jgi:hypothetical protein